MTKKNPRKEYSPYLQTVELMRTLSTEQLNNQDEVDRLLLKKKLDIGATTAGRARALVLRERGEIKEEPTDLNGTENNLMLVSKTAKQVGGLYNLKKIVNLLEKLKGI